MNAFIVGCRGRGTFIKGNVIQVEKGTTLRVGAMGDTWTCDNHVEPITYTEGQTKCEVCGRGKVG